MKIEIIGFERKHLLDINGQDCPFPFDPRALDQLESDPYAATMTVDGIPLFAAGLSLVEGRAELWAVVSARCRGNIHLVLKMNKIFRNIVKYSPLQPVVARARLGFRDAHRALKTIGFRLRSGSRLVRCRDGHYYAMYDQVIG